MGTQQPPVRHLPFEVSSQVASHLGNSDLKNFRLVSSSCALVGAQHLYKILSVSLVQVDIDRLLEVARHEKYGSMVKELVVYEFNFEETLIAMDGEDNIAQIIKDHHSSQATHQSLNEHSSTSERLWEDWLSNVDDAEPAPGRTMDTNQIDVLIRQLAIDYAHAAVASRDKHLAALLGDAIRYMPNLKTLHSRMFSGCVTHRASISHAPTLKIIQQYFPLTDAAIRAATSQIIVSRTPDQAFLTTLNNLATTRGNIDTLNVNCESRYTKQCVGLENLSTVPQSAFQKLRKISLCICCTPKTLSRKFKASLANLLAAATDLEHLELSWDMSVVSVMYQGSTSILPQQTFPKLHTLVLDEFYAEEAKLVAFILLQGRSLRDLTLLSCNIRYGGTWKSVFATLSASKYFQLDHLTINHLRDIPTGDAQTIGKVLSRVDAEDLREYINNGGVNPYTLQRSVCDRTCDGEQAAWPHCCTLGGHINDEINEADFSDMSEWDGDSLIDGLDPDDYDPDGPEYHSDYDSDGEEDMVNSDPAPEVGSSYAANGELDIL